MLDIGDQAPDFSGDDVQGGDTFTLSDHAGQVVVVSFNGLSWCGPCRDEAQVLQELWVEMEPAGVQFVMISVDEDVADFTANLANFGITMPALSDPAIVSAYDVSAVPILYILTRDLKVFQIHRGAGPTLDVMKESIRSDILAALGWPTSDELMGCFYEIARRLGIVFLFGGLLGWKRKPKISGKTEPLAR
jgi:peroxiredoxin